MSGSYNPTNKELAEAIVNHDDYRENLAYNTQYKCFYLWDNGYYKWLDERSLNKIVWNFVGNRFPKIRITMSTVKDIIQQLQLACYLDFEDENDNYIAFKDCLLDLRTLFTVPFDKEKYVTFRLPYLYSEISGEIPNFKKFLSTSLIQKDNINKPDDELILLIQEMFGYLLMSSENLKKNGTAWFLVGGGSNGKSTLMDVIWKIFGKQFCTAFNITQLTVDKFNLPYIISKKVNLAGEEQSKYINSASFKSLITGDPLNAEYKFGVSFTFRPKIKCIYGTNKIPTFDALDYGLKRRIKIIPFYKNFLPNEKDYELDIKLEKELPGIIAWAIKGIKRLLENNYNFTDSKASFEAMKEFASDISSAIMFVSENYIVSPDRGVFITNDLLYENYKNWCSKYGKKPLSASNFSRDIVMNIDGAENKHGRNENGKIVRGKNLVEIESVTAEEEGIDIDKIITDS